MTAASTPPATSFPTQRLYRGVFLAALATLLFEIALTRVLSYTIWYHFAYVAIATALLGYGASGTLLAVRPAIGMANLSQTLHHCALLAAISAVAVLAMISLLPFDPMQITTRASQAALFVLYQLAIAIPFFYSGLAISLSLRAAAQRVDRLYFWDLLGAGVGAALAVGLMNQLTPPGAAIMAAAAFAGAGAVFASSPGGRRRALVLTLLLALLSSFAGRIPFTLAESKHQAFHINVLKMVPVFTRWTALFRTDVVEKRAAEPRLENHWEWGLSPAAGEIQWPWGFVNHDGTAGTGFYDLRAGQLDFLDQHILRLPYLVSPPNPRVLVIGVGGGRDIITALRFGASHVTGVELDPVTVEIIRDDPFGITQGFFRRPNISLVSGEGRHFVKRTRERFDLIQLTGVDTLSAQTSGAYVLAENYLYTVEAFRDYLDHLNPGGVLSITTGHLDDENPNSAGRMISVAQQALRERGVARPEDRIALIPSRNLYADVLIKPEAFDAAQVQRLADAAQQLGFTPLLLPGRASHPAFAALASATGDEREALLAGQKYVLAATTDDSPFFFRNYRWSQVFNADPITPVHSTALGQIVLVLLLVSLSVLGSVFVLGPLLVFRRKGIAGGGRQPVAILLYFLAVGVGFMLFEISLMQRFVLYLGYPTYSLTVTLASLLVFLGCGSFLSRRWVGHERVVLPMAVVAIAVMVVFYSQLLPLIQAATLGMPLAIRIVLSVAMLAPLGLVMGIFFPLGIRRAAEVHEDLVPWAWGINGCASVTATVLAVMLAMSQGFMRVWILSVVIYAVGVAAFLLAGSSPASTSARSAPRDV